MADKKPEVRSLQERDFWKLLKIINRANQSLRAAHDAADDDSTNFLDRVKSVYATVKDAEGNTQIVINEQAALQIVLDALDAMVGQEEAIKEFLASMVSLKVDKFEALPIGSSVEIIQDIIKQDGTRDFLSKLAGLVSGDSAESATSSSPVTAGATA